MRQADAVHINNEGNEQTPNCCVVNALFPCLGLPDARSQRLRTGCSCYLNANNRRLDKLALPKERGAFSSFSELLNSRQLKPRRLALLFVSRRA